MHTNPSPVPIPTVHDEYDSIIRSYQREWKKALDENAKLQAMLSSTKRNLRYARLYRTIFASGMCGVIVSVIAERWPL